MRSLFIYNLRIWSTCARARGCRAVLQKRADCKWQRPAGSEQAPRHHHRATTCACGALRQRNACVRAGVGGLRSWRGCAGVAANRGRSSGRVRERERREERCSRERSLWVFPRQLGVSRKIPVLRYRNSEKVEERHLHKTFFACRHLFFTRKLTGPSSCSNSS